MWAPPRVVPVTVTVAPLGAMLATAELSLFQVTVFPLIALPLASLGVAVMLTDSVGLMRAVDRLSDTLLTVAGGGGFVPPSLPPLPPHATMGLRATVNTSFATRI
jgi:hypothetical protein